LPRPERRLRGLLLAALLAAAPARAADVDTLVDALLRNDNFKVRLKAANSLGQMHDPRVVLSLALALGDPHPLVRAAVAHALGRQKDREALPALCKARDDGDALVRKTVGEALGAFGGADPCRPQHVLVSLDVGGDADLTDLVRTKMTERCAGDARVVLEGTPGGEARPDVEAGRLPGVELKLRVGRTVQRSPSTTVVRCEIFQSVFDMRLRALRGSATQRAEVDLGTPNVTDEAALRNARECLSALVPVVFEGLSDYLDRTR
jgi:hypothetical protein